MLGSSNTNTVSAESAFEDDDDGTAGGLRAALDDVAGQAAAGELVPVVP